MSGADIEEKLRMSEQPLLSFLNEVWWIYNSAYSESRAHVLPVEGVLLSARRWRQKAQALRVSDGEEWPTVVPTSEPQPERIPPRPELRTDQILYWLPFKHVKEEVRDLIVDGIRNLKHKLRSSHRLDGGHKPVWEFKGRFHRHFLPHLRHIVQLSHECLPQPLPGTSAHAHLSLCPPQAKWLAQRNQLKTSHLAQEDSGHLGKEIRIRLKLHEGNPLSTLIVQHIKSVWVEKLSGTSKSQGNIRRWVLSHLARKSMYLKRDSLLLK